MIKEWSALLLPDLNVNFFNFYRTEILQNTLVQVQYIHQSRCSGAWSVPGQITYSLLIVLYIVLVDFSPIKVEKMTFFLGNSRTDQNSLTAVRFLAEFLFYCVTHNLKAT